MRQKEEIEKWEQELMKLRDEINKFYDEIIQMVDEKEVILFFIMKFEGEKSDFEEQFIQLKQSFDELMVSVLN